MPTMTMVYGFQQFHCCHGLPGGINLRRLRRFNFRGVKVIRLALGVQLAAREFYRLIHPRGVRPVRLGDQRVDYSVVDGVASF